MKTFQDYLADMIRQAGGLEALPAHLRQALDKASGAGADARLEAMAEMVSFLQTRTGYRFAHIYTTEHIRDGAVIWRDVTTNLVTDEGLNDILSNYWKGSSYTAAFYVGLTAGSPTPAGGDTMSSHAGWTEVTAYDEATRPALTLGAVSAQSVDNSGSKAVFTISGIVTAGGAFISTDNTRGGTTGLCIGVAAFDGGNRAVVDNDVINVTATLTAADAV